MIITDNLLLLLVELLIIIDYYFPFTFISGAESALRLVGSVDSSGMLLNTDDGHIQDLINGAASSSHLSIGEEGRREREKF